MKEPWKKTCNGKVIITLNDEKTEPTEVEVPVDLNWTNRTDKKCSSPKVVILVCVGLLLGLSLVTLFKVQNLIYSTSFINWRMQELESSVGDSSDDIKLIKYKLSLEERDEDIASIRAVRAEPLVAAAKGRNQIDSHDLKLSESQNQNHKLTSNSLTENEESKKEENSQGKSTQSESKENKEDDPNDGRNHPNPSDPEEWIKPLVETFDIIGNQPIEDGFIHNVLMKLLMPEKDFEVVELNKMQESGNSQESDGPKINVIPLMRNMREKQAKPLPIESILMKSLLPPMSNFKIFHFNEKSESQSQSQEEEQMIPKVMKIKQVLPPPIENIMKALLPPNNMRVFHFNDKPEQNNNEEDIPKITIQSIKLKLLPLPPQEEFQPRREMMRDPMREPMNMNNFEVIRLNESPEPSQEVEAPRAPMPMQMPVGFNAIPIPIHDIMRTILPASKNIEIVPLHERPEDHQPMPQQQPSHSQDDMGIAPPEHKFNPFNIPFQDIIMKTLTPPSQNAEAPFNSDQQEHSNQDIEMQKIPIRTLKINPFPIPEALMKSMLPISRFSEAMDSMTESHEDNSDSQPQLPEQPQPESQPQTPEQPQSEDQSQTADQNQQSESQPSEEQPEKPQTESTPAPQEPAKGMVRSTKLNPVDSTWDLPQYAREPAQN